MNINYKYFPCYGAVIYNFFRNCLTVRSHDPFWGIIYNNIHRNIETMNNQGMLTNNSCVCVTVKVCLLIFVICKDCVNSHGPYNRGNISFTNNSPPCQCRIFTIGCGRVCSLWLWWWFHDRHQFGYLLHQLFRCTTLFGPNLLFFRLVSPGLSLIVELWYLVRIKCLIFLLAILYIFKGSSTAALTFLLSSSFVVRWIYPWNIQIRRRDLLSLID